MAIGIGISEEAIQKLIQDALAAQADTHRTELAALAARFQNSSASAAPTTLASPIASSTRSTVPRTRLNMGSPSLVYNGLGGTSTSAMSKAAVSRAFALALASSSSTSPQEDFYILLTMDQSKIEKALNEGTEDPVTESGLMASLTFFDEYNHRGGRIPGPHLAPNLVAGSGCAYSG